jgi:hypothetical protein
MHNRTFVNKANFVKLYNNFVLKWLILALYVVVEPEQIVREHLEDTLRICDVSAMGLYSSHCHKGPVIKQKGGGLGKSYIWCLHVW